jgi:hypothetical protein
LKRKVTLQCLAANISEASLYCACGEWNCRNTGQFADLLIGRLEKGIWIGDDSFKPKGCEGAMYVTS